VTGDALCPALDDAGRRCQRWNLPAAHTDRNHQNGRRRWPYIAPPEQLALDLTDAAARAAPARMEAP
jgi:hypothetical protein